MKRVRKIVRGCAIYLVAYAVVGAICVGSAIIIVEAGLFDAGLCGQWGAKQIGIWEHFPKGTWDRPPTATEPTLHAWVCIKDGEVYLYPPPPEGKVPSAVITY